MAGRRTFGSIRKLPSGRLQARYRGPDGERYTAPTTFMTKTDASRWLGSIETEISRGQWVSPNAPKIQDNTFGEYAETWLALNSSLKAGTHGLYKRMLTRSHLTYFVDMEVASITSGVVQKWFAGLPATPTENARNYSLLCTIMNAAVEDESQPIEVNPCRIKKARKVKRTKTVKVLGDAEVKALAEAMPDRYRALVYVAAYACLRFGEQSELRRKDVVNGELQIRRAVSMVHRDDLPVWASVPAGWKGTYVPIVDTPKSEAGVRDVPLPSFVSKALAEHLLQYAEPGDEGLVFTKAWGGRATHSALYETFKRARIRIGRPDLSWHDLRHTGAVSWALEGATIKELMTLLGHETPAMAMNYQHVAQGRLSTLAARVSDRVVGQLLDGPIEVEVVAVGE